MSVLGWLGTLVVLASYAWTVREGDPRPFHYGNVIGSLLLVIFAASIGAWPNVVLSGAFGLLGVIAIAKENA